MSNIIIIGPAHPLRGGGMVTFNQRLAKEFIDKGHSCTIVSFSLQYPSFLFPGTSQTTTEAAPTYVSIRSLINSINLINWIKVGYLLKKEKPDLIVVRFWIPFMGPALGTILRILKKNKHSKIICIADNIIPHEKRVGDSIFTRYFLNSCDAFITMSENVLNDLHQFIVSKPAVFESHPPYDNFENPVSKKDAREFLNLSSTNKIILFFGFIRAYKGLDILLHSMADERLKKSGIQLLVAGEFYESEAEYKQLVSQLAITENVLFHTNFIPNAEVHYYLCAADVVMQPYRAATQSGVTPLAYHFEKPIIVTNVGSLAAYVPHEKVGLVTNPDSTSIADAILKFYELGENYFIPQLRSEKEKYSWNNMVTSILKLAKLTS